MEPSKDYVLKAVIAASAKPANAVFVPFPNLRKRVFMCTLLYLIAWPGEILAVEKAWKKVFVNVGLWALWRQKREAQFVYFYVLGKRKEQQLRRRCGVTSN